MKNSNPSNQTRLALHLPPGTQAPHRNWPQTLTDSGLTFDILERYLAEHPGDVCEVYKFCFGDRQERLLWRESTVFRDVVDLERIVRDQVSCVRRWW
jgi:hypothetical protein